MKLSKTSFLGKIMISFTILSLVLSTVPVAVWAQEIGSEPAAAEEPRGDIAPTSEIVPPAEGLEPEPSPAPVVEFPGDLQPPVELLEPEANIEPESSQATEGEEDVITVNPVLPPYFVYDLNEKSKKISSTVEVNEADGSLNYLVDLAIPAGRNNLQPDIRLRYNSNGGRVDNPFGYGWSINLPSIERINKTGVEDMYNQNDFYSSLSGELVSVSGNLFGAKIENGQFIKYELNSGVWTATDKLGTIYTFGSDSNALQYDPNNSSHVFKWMLSKIEDTNGNTVTYAYYKDYNQIYPSNINYTGYQTATGIFDVDFVREARNDISTSTATGFSVVTRERIQEIQVKINGVWEKKYNLNYSLGANGHKSLLQSVVETGKDSQGLPVTWPPTSFTYENDGEGIFLDSTFNPANIPVVFYDEIDEDMGSRVFDVNGDGLDDIAWALTNYFNEVWINQGNNTWTRDLSYTIPVDFYSGTRDNGVRAMDANGDGLVDLIEASGTYGGGYVQKAYLNNGQGWTYTPSFEVPKTPFTDTTWGDVGTFTLEINGDGLPDILQSYKQGSENIKRIFINEGNGLGWQENFTISTSSLPEFVEITSGPNPVNNNFGYRTMDANGDGLDDIVRSHFDPNTHYEEVWINQGKIEGNNWVRDYGYDIPVYFMVASVEQGVRVFDFNADGLQDLLQSGNGTRAVYLNNGDGTGWTQVSGITLAFDDFYNANLGDQGVRPIDINGDTMPDIMRYYVNSQDVSSRAVSFHQGKRVDMLTGITSKDGAEISVSYKASAQYKDGAANLLNPDARFNMMTVNQISLADGLGNLESRNYEYAEGAYYFNTSFDRKSAGFGKVTKTLGDTKTVTYFHQGNESNSSQGEYQDNYYKIGQPYRTEVYASSTQTLLSQELNKWEDLDLGANRKFVFSTQKSNTDFTGTDKSVASQFVYNTSNGNLTTEHNLGEVVVNTGTGDITDQLIGDEKDTNYLYAQNTTKHILSAPKTKVISETSSSKQQDLYYDNLPLGDVDKVNLTKEDYVNGTEVEVNRIFSSYGLVEKEVSPEKATTTIAYDTFNLYPDTKTNPLNQVTSYDYNLLNGQPGLTTAPNGAVTQNTFDAFGRLTKVEVSNPDNPSQLVTKQEIIYSDDFAHFPHHIFNVDSYTQGLWHMNGPAGSASKRQEVAHGYNLVEQGDDNIQAGYDFYDTTNPQGSYDLDGVDDRMTVNSSAFNFGPGDFSLEAWIKTTVNDEKTIITKWEVGEDDGYELYLVAGTGVPRFSVYQNGTTHTATGNIAVNDGNWHYLAAVRIGPIVRIYVDGNYAGGNGYGSTLDPNNNGPLKLGTSRSGLIHTDMFLDEVRLSNTARSEQEIYDYYNYGIPDIFKYKESKDYFTPTNYTTSREYYDGLDRVVQSKTQLASGNYATIDTNYDNQGRVNRQSLSYETNSLAYSAPDLNKPAKTYTYDALDRVLTETTPVGLTIYQYDGLTTIITDPNGVRKDLTNDAYGNLVEVKEYNNNGANIYTTSYEYSLTNKLTKITDSVNNIRNFTYDALDNLTNQDMVHKPATTPPSITYTHDKNGNVLTETSFKSDNISYIYDDINRVLFEKLSGTNKITYSYDDEIKDIGQLALADYGGGNKKTYDYDVLGRLRHSTTTIDNINYVLHYDYNLAGSLTQVAYPNSYRVKYDYNTIGQISTVSLDKGQGYQSLASNISYNPNGQMTHLERANGVITDYTYDPTQDYRLTDIDTIKNTTVLQDIHYTYDDNGNILNLTDNSSTNLAKTVTYQYDDLNRLTSATVNYTNPSMTDYTRTYQYDSIGNMTSNSALGTMNYTNNQPHQLSSYPGKTLTYDDAGNVLNNSVNEFTYDWRSRMDYSRVLLQPGKTYYEYDHNNQRYLKYTTLKVYHPYPCEEDPPEGLGAPLSEGLQTEGESMLLDCGGYYTIDTIDEDKYIDKYFEKALNNDTKSHVFLNSIKLATINNTSTPYFVISDHLGSSSILTDNTGNIAEVSDYEPYGTVNYNQTITEVGDHYKFNSKEFDLENSLQYYGARYLNNNEARFYSVDSKLIKAIESALYNPQDLNSYAYTRNNPVILVDPNGEDAQDVAYGSVNGFWSGLKHTGQGLSQLVHNPTVVITSMADFFKDSYDSAVLLAEIYKADPNGAAQLLRESFADAGQKFSNLSDEQKGEIFGYALEKGLEAYVATKSVNKGMKSGGTKTENTITLRNLVDRIAEIRSQKGNFGITAGTADEALQLGRAWAGDVEIAKNGKIIGYKSHDGLRAFRFMSKDGILEANFQENILRPNGTRAEMRNAHMRIIQ